MIWQIDLLCHCRGIPYILSSKRQDACLYACLFITDVRLSSRFFGGGQGEEEEDKVVKGDDVIVDLDASLEDLYMGGSLKVILCPYVI